MHASLVVRDSPTHALAAPAPPIAWLRPSLGSGVQAISCSTSISSGTRPSRSTRSATRFGVPPKSRKTLELDPFGAMKLPPSA